MTTYSTGNPVGSPDPRDLYDNAENLDNAANSDNATWTDRLGQSRRTMAGIEQDAIAAIQNAGYVGTGADNAVEDYAAGIEITQYNQIVRDGGEFWRVSGSETLPYTTTGAGVPEGGALVSVGDAALRQDLAAGVQAGQGAFLISDSLTYLSDTDSLETLPAGAMAQGQHVSVRNRGDYIFSDGEMKHAGPAKGPSQVDRLLSSTNIKGMYVYAESASDTRIGYSFVGEDNPVSEYTIKQDGEGWWRLYGAFTGFSETSSLRNPMEVNPELVGSFTFASTPSTYTTNIGDKLRAFYSGRSLTFRSYRDDRGGVWQFRLNGGHPVDISTYAETSEVTTQVVYGNLDPNKVYLVEAEFMGEDPENPPSSTPARGWVYFRDPSTGGEYADGQRAFGQVLDDQARMLDQNASTSPQEIISAAGINEFAFKVQKVGSTLDDVWVPYHGGESMLEDLESLIIVDGKPIDSASDLLITGPVTECKNVRFVQRFKFKQPGETGTFGILTSIHQFNEDGTLDFNYSINATDEFQINTWYAYQFMTNRDHTETLYLNNDTRIDISSFTDGQSFQRNDLNVNSVAFLGLASLSRGMYHGSAMDVNFRSAYAQNKKAEESPSQMLITSRAGSVAKIYWQTGGYHVMQAGDSFQASYRVCAVTGIIGPNDLRYPHMGSLF